MNSINFEEQMSAIDSKLALSFPLNKRVQEASKLIYPQTATKMNISNN
ncbi:hypothetical protein [Nostoc sp.]